MYGGNSRIYGVIVDNNNSQGVRTQRPHVDERLRHLTNGVRDKSPKGLWSLDLFQEFFNFSPKYRTVFECTFYELQKIGLDKLKAPVMYIENHR